MNWKSIKNKIQHFLYTLTHNKLFYWDGNPYRWIWNARKDFKIPVISFHVIDKKIYDKPNHYIHDHLIWDESIILIRELSWKSKYGMYRFEYCPVIQLNLFGKYFIWLFESPDGDNLRYYESIMEYLWTYNRNIDELRKNCKWTVFRCNMGETEHINEGVLKHGKK